MKRKKRPLQSNLLRRSNQTISIVLGFALLLGALVACVLTRSAPGDREIKTLKSPVETAR
jgi:hypothetical protein